MNGKKIFYFSLAPLVICGTDMCANIECQKCLKGAKVI